MAELNLFGNFTYKELIEEMKKQGKTPEEIQEDEKKDLLMLECMLWALQNSSLSNCLRKLGG